jgi:hypothetical protein
MNFSINHSITPSLHNLPSARVHLASVPLLLQVHLISNRTSHPESYAIRYEVSQATMTDIRQLHHVCDVQPLEKQNLQLRNFQGMEGVDWKAELDAAVRLTCMSQPPGRQAEFQPCQSTGTKEAELRTISPQVILPTFSQTHLSDVPSFCVSHVHVSDI